MLNLLKKFALVFLIFCSAFSHSIELQKPTQYQPEKYYTGWLMSEKLDGIRGVWNGKQLVTRSGRLIHAPRWFLQQFPPFSLDGELWTKQQNFENIQSIVMDHTPSTNWRDIAYYVFEVPDAKGNFTQRLNKIKQWLKTHPRKYISVIKQIKISNKKHLNDYFKFLVKKGAEGIIIKNPKLSYFSGRSRNIVKRKMSYDMEAMVLATVEGKGKNKDKMGSLKVKTASGKIFKIGTGFNNEQRSNPPKVGETIRFKYYGLTAKGIPKHASFLNIRKD